MKEMINQIVHNNNATLIDFMTCMDVDIFSNKERSIQILMSVFG